MYSDLYDLRETTCLDESRIPTGDYAYMDRFAEVIAGRREQRLGCHQRRNAEIDVASDRRRR